MENDATVFTMYLNSVTGFPSLANNTVKSNVSWNINFDNFFEGEQVKWHKCRVRVQYISDASNSVTIAAANGVLVGSFASRYNNPQIANVPLGIVQVVTSPTSGDNIIVVDTLQTLGQNINIPTGSCVFNLALWKSGYGSGDTTSGVINTLNVPFQAMLQFELYDPRD
jgi:hypothetical protein